LEGEPNIMKNLQNLVVKGRKEKIKQSSSLKIVFVVLSIIFLSTTIFAQQKGSISGVIKDESNNDILIGANILIAGTNIGASTDLDGYYSIKGLNPGLYDLKISYISYNNVTVEKVKVESGKDTKISISLKPTSTQLGEVIVSADMIKSTEGALLQIQKNSLNIVDGLSSELISKTTVVRC
jgi:hypothetical protein